MGALLLLHALAALSLQAAEPRETAPAGDALVDRFLAVIPDAHLLESPQWDLEAARLTRLMTLNPGRSSEVEAAREIYRRCTAPTAAAVTLRLLRDTARGLGDEKLGRLITLYQGRDFAVLNGIAERGQSGEPLSEADLAEAARITSAYPIVDYMESLEHAQSALFQDDVLIDALVRCEEELRSALATRNLRDE